MAKADTIIGGPRFARPLCFDVGYPNMLIIIDGPINSGKTTVSRRLASLVGQCIVVECDHLRHFADCLTLDQSIPYTLNDAANLAARWLDRGFSVIINYPISPDEIHFVENHIPDGVHYHRFSLQPSIDVCQKQRGTRELDAQEIGRIKDMYDDRSKNGVIGKIIDNSLMTAAECAEVIHAEIANKAIQSDAFGAADL
jgi:cytidylate kinase